MKEGKRLSALLIVLIALVLCLSNVNHAFAADRYEVEPNNTRANADRINNDDDVYGRINYAGDIDWYIITFSQNGSANFWLGNKPTGCSDIKFELYNANGILLATSATQPNTQEQLYDFNVSATTYYIRVYTISGTSYNSGANAFYKFRAKNYRPIVTTGSYTHMSSDTVEVRGSYSNNNPNARALEYGFEFGSASNNLNNTQVRGTSTAEYINNFSSQIGPFAPNTTYYYRAYVKTPSPNETIRGSISNFLTLPQPPTNITVTDYTHNSVSLSWRASSGTGSVTYSVYRDNGILCGSNISGTSFTVTGLSENTPYTFYLQARNATGTSSSSSTVPQRTREYPYVSVTPDPYTFPPSGGTQNFTVSTNQSSWRVAGIPSWLTYREINQSTFSLTAPVYTGSSPRNTEVITIYAGPGQTTFYLLIVGQDASNTTYPVTYYLNGGSGSVPQTRNYRPGETVQIEAGSMTRTGWTFRGWRINESAGDPHYRYNGSTFTPPSFVMGSSSVYLYAIWEQTTPVPTSVKFDQESYSATIPTSGSTSIPVTARVYDQNGNAMSGSTYYPTYSINPTYAGVGITRNADGSATVTIQSTAAEGTANIRATYGSLGVANASLRLSKVTTPVITIITQPNDEDVTQGSINKILTIAARVTPSGTLSYQWYQRLGQNLNPTTDTRVGTGTNFTIPTTLTSLGSPYFYYCIVSAAGVTPIPTPVTSSVAKVTVSPAGSLMPPDLNIAGVTENSLKLSWTHSEQSASATAYYEIHKTGDNNRLAIVSKGAAMPYEINNASSGSYFVRAIASASAQSETSASAQSDSNIVVFANLEDISDEGDKIIIPIDLVYSGAAIVPLVDWITAVRDEKDPKNLIITIKRNEYSSTRPRSVSVEIYYKYRSDVLRAYRITQNTWDVPDWHGFGYQDLALRIHNNKNITFLDRHPAPPDSKWNNDGATANDNINDALQDRRVKMSGYRDGSLGGGLYWKNSNTEIHSYEPNYVYDTNDRVSINNKVLKAILAIAEKYGELQVTSITGAAHVSTSQHFEGRAIDFTRNIKGVSIEYNENDPNTEIRKLLYDKRIITNKTKEALWGYHEGNYIHIEFDNPARKNTVLSVASGYSIFAAVSDESEEVSGEVSGKTDGDIVTLVATPNEGYAFDGWYENVDTHTFAMNEETSRLVSTENPYTFTATRDIELEARFKSGDKEHCFDIRDIIGCNAVSYGYLAFTILFGAVTFVIRKRKQ